MRYLDLLENQNLLSYLTTKSISNDEMDNDLYRELWGAFLDYLNPANVKRLEDYLDMPITEITWGEYYDLPATVHRAFANWMEEHNYTDDVLHQDPHNAPAWMLLHLNDAKVLPENTWIVHFTDHPDAIQRQGFQRGVDNLDQLALTRLNSITGHSERRTSDGPGYNFGYLAVGGTVNVNHRVAANSPTGGYGRHAVLFRSAGVSVYHAGDREDQVIFYGPDVIRRSITVLRARGRLWTVTVAGQPFQSRSLSRCVGWVIAQHP